MRKRRHAPRGQTLVEFALIVPVFILLIAGLFDGARAVFAYNTIANAAREGAREAIVHQDEDAVRAVVRRAGVGLGLTDADIALVPCATKDCEYTVTVTYAFNPVVPGLNSIFTPTLRSSVSMPLEFENP